MVDIDRFEQMLDQIADTMPEALFTELNGGILLQPEAKVHPQSVGDDLYILGEYHRDGIFGRFIVLYYGSFEKTYPMLSRRVLRQHIERVLKHEFLHHVESLAGERGLEVTDAVELAQYLQGRQ